jgi:hypothetical protein
MHQLLPFVGTKLPIAMVGLQIILAMGEKAQTETTIVLVWLKAGI